MRPSPPGIWFAGDQAFSLFVDFLTLQTTSLFHLILSSLQPHNPPAPLLNPERMWFCVKLSDLCVIALFCAKADFRFLSIEGHTRDRTFALSSYLQLGYLFLY